MRVLKIVIAVLVGLLSLAAGAAKVARVPEEVAFLGQFGFSPALTVAYGVVQVLGGLLLLIPKTRRVGAIVTALGFVLSSVLLTMAGNLAIAAISIIPIFLAAWIGVRPHQVVD